MKFFYHKARFKQRIHDFRNSLGDRILRFGLNVLPEGSYKTLIFHAFCDVHAEILDNVGQTEKAREIRRAIAPMRLGGRRADRARRRKRFA